MTLKTYALLSTIFLSLIAFIHLFRILCQWDVMIDDWSAPMWVSYAIVPPAGLLSFAGFRLMPPHWQILGMPDDMHRIAQ